MLDKGQLMKSNQIALLVLGLATAPFKTSAQPANPLQLNSPYQCNDGMSVQGIGLLEGRKADPSFEVAPGESRNATFTTIRYNSGRQQIGTSFNYDFASRTDASLSDTKRRIKLTSIFLTERKAYTKPQPK